MTPKKLPLAQTRPGMVLAVALRDGAGVEMLAAGAELTETLLASLTRRGVTHLQVAGDEQPSAEELAAQRTAVAGRLDFLFRKAGDDPLMAALRDALLAYRLEELP